MPLSTNEIPTIFRDEAYEAFLTELPQQSEELEKSGFYDIFDSTDIDVYSTFKTHIYGSYNAQSGRNPGEPMPPGTMGQGYNYFTAIRAEHSEIRSIPGEYLVSTIKLKDYAQTQGAIMAQNYVQKMAEYYTALFSYGGIAPATLAALDNGSPGQRPLWRIFAHYLKGELGAVISNIPVSDAADPDGKGWFAFQGNEHARSNGDTTSASFTGKTLGYFNAGNRTGANMRLTADNLEQLLLHMENDLPYGPDRKFYAAKSPDTLLVSGNLRSIASQIVDLNEYRLNSANNDKNPMWKQSKVFGIKNVIVNRFLPDNCWYVGAQKKGVKMVGKKGDLGIIGFDGPAKSTVCSVWQDMGTQTWMRSFLGFFSHWFDENMDICWAAGSTPTAVGSTNMPTAPTNASLQDW